MPKGIYKHKPLSEETKMKLSKVNKGENNSFYGKQHTLESKLKISKVHKGKPLSEETKRKIRESSKGNIPWNKGLKNVYSDEIKSKMSKAHKGFKFSEESKQKMSKASKGKTKPPITEEQKEILSKIAKEKGFGKWMLGRKLSKEIREKISKSLSGKNGPSWQGGKSFEPYTTDWTQTLKRSIRERDHYVCQLCGELQGDRAFSVHHIDYNKKNCSPDNLITLCVKCHSKTNHNRDYWIKYFKMINSR